MLNEISVLYKSNLFLMGRGSVLRYAYALHAFKLDL